jgi:photosystem II stability/assembly factor-like uncharacterized protein
MATSKFLAVLCITLVSVPGICGPHKPRSTSVGVSINSFRFTPGSVDSEPIASKAKRTLANKPLHFEEATGNSTSETRFTARSGAVDLNIGATDAVMRLRSSDQTQTSRLAQPTAIAMKLVGSNHRAALSGEDALPSHTNYFIGNDQKQWRTNVAQFGRVRVQNVYAGIDVVYYGSAGGFEYDFNIKPGASPTPIRLKFNGVNRVHVSKSGDLELATTVGILRHHKPIAYQLKANFRREVNANFFIDRNGLIGVRLGDYDKREALIIDPVLSFSTYLGGHDDESVTAVAVDNSGNVYITGTTNSADFPLKSPLQPVKTPPFGDVFIAKLNPSGTALIYSTYLGGSLQETATGIAVDNFGNAFVTGNTSSIDFPVTGQAFQATRRGSFDAFVTGITANGSSFIYSSYFGGSSDDSSNRIAIDAAGNIVIVGSTSSDDFPTTAGVVQRVLNTPLRDAFVTKFNGAGHGLIYSTFLGGSGSDEAMAIAVDAAGNVYVTGDTTSEDFPVTTGAMQSRLSRVPGPGFPPDDAFVTKLNPDGTQLIYSTFLGGTFFDHAKAITTDGSGAAYVAGMTASFDFPTTNATLQHDFGGGFFKSGNSGRQWRSSNSGLATPTPVALAVDPRVRGHLILASADGVYSSTDAGEGWSKISNTLVTQLVMDPADPAVLYGSNSDGVIKSIDGGVNWTLSSNSLPRPFSVSQLFIDPVRSSNLYVYGLGFFPNVLSDDHSPYDASPTGPPPPNPHFFFRSTNAGTTWEEVHSLFIPPQSSGLVVLDSHDPSRLFLTSAHFGGTNLFRSQDRGVGWRLMNNNTPYTPVITDPTTGGIIYGLAEGVGKSTDDGKSWTEIGKGLPKHPGIKSLYAVPTSPTTLYASTRDGIFKSVDAGANWQLTDLRGDISFFEFDPSKLSMIYAGVNDPSNAFVAKVNPIGSALVYSTFLGGQSADEAHNVAVDGTGNAYVAGMTSSGGFPTVNALQATRPDSRIETFPSPIAAFLSKLDAAGSRLRYSTYLGGDDYTIALSVVTTQAGDVVVAGQTAASNFPVKNGLQSFAAGSLDGFVLKFAAPSINGLGSFGKDLMVVGQGFDHGAIVLFDGQEQITKQREGDSASLTVKKGVKLISPGQLVKIQVRNSDGTLSNTIDFTR